MCFSERVSRKNSQKVRVAIAVAIPVKTREVALSTMNQLVAGDLPTISAVV
jgi:hypothetical protein